MGQHQETEEWRDIRGFEGRYIVSNNGVIKSLPVKKKNRNGSFITKERVLKNISKNGYFVVGLFKDWKNNVRYVHRLVADAFIINEGHKPQVNHKNGIKVDNKVENLEWCTSKENAEHSVLTGLKKSARGSSHAHYRKFGAKNHTSKKVAQLNIDSSRIIKIYGGISEASRETGVHRTNISMVCNGKRKSGGGYKWETI